MRAWRGPAASLSPLVGYLGGVTRVTSLHSAAATYQAEVLLDNPLVLWPLDVDGRDVSGNERDLTTVSESFLTEAPAPWPACLDLNGSTEYAEYATPTALNLAGPLTYEAWVRRPAQWADSDLGAQVIGLNDRVGIRQDGNELRNVAFVLREDDATTIGQGNWGLSAELDADDGEVWVHVVGVYDRDLDTQRIFINGSAAGTASTGESPAAATNVTSPFSIGCQYDQPAVSGATRRRFMKGQVAWVAIYGSALSAARIQAHYDKRGVTS